ncbi:MAG: ATP-binding protein [Oscillospiraceae bacterium]|nr:ATP-binding protein [Oscillospiraceae bacterium]
MSIKLIKRNVESIVMETIKDTPVTVIQGARQVGKSTLSTMISKNMVSKTVTFDSDIALATAKENTQEFAAQFPEGLLIIDEIQKCPELLSAIKMSVDSGRKPGRFLVTGSANILNLRGANESLAGRAETIILEPFSIGEMCGIKEDFVSLLLCGDMLARLNRVTPFTRTEYARLIESGGYPDAQSRSGRRREAFFRNYLTRVLDHDANELSGLAHIDRFQTIFALLAGRPSQIYIRANVSRTIGIPESSMNGYIRLLENLGLIHILPAWGKNYSKRAIGRPKIVLSDTGLVCSINGISSSFLSKLENGNELGPVFEAFVINEIMKQQTWSDVGFTTHHYRDKDGKEVDLVLELRGGKVIAIEIKAASSFSKKDFTGMKALRDMLGDRFHCGVLLYTGNEVQPFGDRLYCAPASSIWQFSM